MSWVHSITTDQPADEVSTSHSEIRFDGCTTLTTADQGRALGIAPPGEPGPFNAITDVADVEVGVTTLIDGDGPLVVGEGPVRTGVTAILPRGRDGLGQPCAAGWYSLNGNGEMTGTTWIDEAGSFNLPVVLSNTHAIGACHTGVIRWVNRVNPCSRDSGFCPCARRRGTATSTTSTATTSARSTSRRVRYGDNTFTVAAFVQANFGSRAELTVAGRHIGPDLLDDIPLDGDWFEVDLGLKPPSGAG
jgi:L-aminopeptidase/D-esterase-like protein